MNPKLNILLTLLLLVAGTFSVSAQIVDAQGQYVDTVFNDNVDRTAEDFVIASLLISDPIEGLLSPAGHTAIRVQCPVFDLDYVYHYMTINEKDSITETRAFLTGQFVVQMVADSFDTYIRRSEEQQRGLTEYPINLTPQEDQKLWQILDETLEKSQQMRYEFVKQGCCARSIIIIIKVLGKKHIDYSACNPRYSRPPYELVASGMSHVPWLRFFMLTAMYGTFRHTEQGDNLFIPADLADAWQCAMVDGHPLLGDGVRLLPNSYVADNSWLTPMRLALLLLIISLFAFAMKSTYLDWIILVVQVLMSVLVLIVSVLGASFISWNWLLIPFNILPAICWRWRRYWALPYVGVSITWCLVMLFVPHMLVDTTHIILTLAFAIVLLKQSNILQRWLQKSVVQDMKKTHYVTNKN